MEKTWKPTVGGVLTIIGGTIELIVGVVVAAIGSIGWFFGMAWFSAIGAPLIIVGIIAIVGGIYALKRKLWGLALVGSICALFGPWGLLGLLATIFVSLGKGEFK
jgi:hypothetical protein